MFKLIGKFSFPYKFEGKDKDGRSKLIEGTAYRFEFYNPDFIGTIRVKVRENDFNRFDELVNNTDIKYLFTLSKDNQIILKSII